MWALGYEFKKCMTTCKSCSDWGRYTSKWKSYHFYGSRSYTNLICKSCDVVNGFAQSGVRPQMGCVECPSGKYVKPSELGSTMCAAGRYSHKATEPGSKFAISGQGCYECPACTYSSKGSFEG